MICENKEGGIEMEEKPVEIKQVSEKEIWIGKSRFYLDDDNIIHSVIFGDIDENMAIAFDEASLKLMNMVEGKVNVLTDNNKAGKPISKARKIMQEFILHEK